MTLQNGISAVVLVKNEEQSIVRCLKSLLFCNEIIVIDDYSVDASISKIKPLKPQVFKRHLKGDFGEQRNFALTKTNYEWVLFVDADEVVPRALAKEIKSVIKSTQYSAYQIPRSDVLWGQKLFFGEMSRSGAFGNTSIIRLGKRNAGKWKRKIHETWNIKGTVGVLSNELLHYPHQNMQQFIGEIGVRFISHSKEIQREGKPVSIQKVIAWPVGKFFYNIILRQGFRDGIRGFILATIMSFHSFLSWSQLWLQKRRNI